MAVHEKYSGSYSYEFFVARRRGCVSCSGPRDAGEAAGLSAGGPSLHPDSPYLLGGKYFSGLMYSAPDFCLSRSAMVAAKATRFFACS